MSSTKSPHALTIRAYQVGFGDCFLLSFHYEREDRHVLIDFGSTYKPKKLNIGLNQLMLDVANDIARECKGKLHAVVATHRHRDHISGFTTGDDEQEAPGDIIARLEPDVVIQPWTEDPLAQPEATQPMRTLSSKKGFLAALNDMHFIAGAAVREASQMKSFYKTNPELRFDVVKQIEFLGDDNKIANRSAIENLIRMSQRKGRAGSRDARAFYVYHGSQSGLEDILPGVVTQVLGPPTLEQTDAIRQQRSRDENEYWHLQASAGRAVAGSRSKLFPFAAIHPESENPPPHTRWFIRHMQTVRANQLLGIVRELDSQLNNTSLILLFKVRGKKFLFPGDAQIENWSYALFDAPDSARTRRLLSRVNLYKVGHHGSLNATPRSLWALFENRSDKPTPQRLLTLISTMEDSPHGHKETKTEVPRRTLVAELRKESEFFTTEQSDPDTHPPRKTIKINFRRAATVKKTATAKKNATVRKSVTATKSATAKKSAKRR
ncbi:MAG TPA: hypothetical protein VF666_13065 [Pyrinomonadaceae bacterium]|jgi:hypothetical protein